MILNNESKQNVIVNADSTQKLSISLNENDQAILIDLQINKLYRNKIRAVVQEYMSNARDANVDAGKKDEPIHVHIPTRDNPIFSVRDSGIGMSPEIIKNYICVVGASTKRDNNNALGCFGYGSKCGYAYVNEHGQQFSITTIFEGVKYSYLLFYDDKHFPNVSLLAQEPTTEPSGTIVEIPVEKYDCDDFNKEIRNILQYWIGTYNFNIVNESVVGKISEPNRVNIVSEDNYVIHGGYGYNRKVTVIVGGIPYNYDISHDLLDYHEIDINMPIGSMNITPSREDLEITKNNTEKIKEVLDAAYAKLDEYYKSLLTTFSSELDIFKKYHDRIPEYMFANLKFNCNDIEYNRTKRGSIKECLSSWLSFENIGRNQILDNVVFIDLGTFKNYNIDKIRYNYPGKQIVILKQLAKDSYWKSRYNELKNTTLSEFSKNLLEQIKQIVVPYSSLKNKPRERSARTEEPTYWIRNCSNFEPRYDDISNLSGVWFLGSSLKPVESEVELVLPRDGMTYGNAIGIPGDIFMIPKRNEKKAQENKNLVKIMDKAKEILISPENVALIHSQIGLDIFGNNYLDMVCRNVHEISKDEVLKSFISKMAFDKSWSGYKIVKRSNSIPQVYKKIYGKEFSTPEIDYIRSKYSICSKVKRLEYHEMKELVEYVWSK